MARTAVICPWPPSIRITSGQAGKGGPHPRRLLSDAAVGLAFFLQQAREPPCHHFAHHAEVVAGRDVGRFDVELAVLAFDEAFRPRHHHAADGIGAHDVRVVVDLDAARHVARKLEGLGEAFEQARLRGGFGELAAMRLAGIGDDVLDQILLLAALRHEDRDLVAGLFAERRRQQFLIPRPSRESRICRGTGLVVVELREEGVQHFGAGQRSDRPSGNRRGCPSSGRCGRRTPGCRRCRPRDGWRRHRLPRRRPD